MLVEMTSDEEQAQLEEARATVAEARRQYERIRSLRERIEIALNDSTQLEL